MGLYLIREHVRTGEDDGMRDVHPRSVLVVDVSQLGRLVDGRQIPEETAQPLYPHRLGVKSEGETGCDGEEATEGEDFGR